MGWRDKYKVHPAADVFPMMSEEELDATAADIKANGLREPLAFRWQKTPKRERLLIDGRNRLEAMERVGIELPKMIAVKNGSHTVTAQNVIEGDPVAYIISKNIHRRHLTKEQQADLIVAARKTAADKPVQAEPVSKGGRGHKNALKAAVIADAKKVGISESTAKRAIAKAEGKKPKPKSKELFAALERELRRTKPKPVELPNTGCNYDPADPRGATQDEELRVIRRRAWLVMAHDSVEQAESFLAEDDHRAIAVADAAEIDMEVVLAVKDAAEAWIKVGEKLQEVSGLSHEKLGLERLKRGEI